MFRLKPVAAALAAAGILCAAAGLSPGVAGETGAAVLGLGAPSCGAPGSGYVSARTYLRLARADALAASSGRKTEVAPFGQAVRQVAPAILGAEDPPLFDELRRVHMEITTTQALAQHYFDQGLTLAYGFNHDEARRAFRAAQGLDPECAMCYWGEAYVLGPNLNAPMEPSATASAYGAIQRAQALAARASEKERVLIAALAKRYALSAEADRRALDAAYADAMAEAAQRFPDDSHVAVLFADAVMNLSPWDYWAAGGARPKGRTAEAQAALERVLAADPDHPGAIHFYIHLMEASTAPEKAEPYADRLARLGIGVGHLHHMPSHIYYRVGRYRDSLEANRSAVAVDEAYLARVRAQGIYPSAYYPHNVHFLLVSAQMAGDGKTVIEAAHKLDRVVTEEGMRATPWVQPIKVAPYFAHAQFSDPATILAIPDPGGAFPYVKAMWHYARGVAQAANGDVPAALKEAQAIEGIARTADFGVLAAAGIPAKEVLAIARHVIEGRVAQAREDFQGAVAAFEKAVAIEDTLAYMEPPYWYYPVRQSLGAALLQVGQLDRAEEAFRTSLARAPNNGWALYGLLEIYKRRGETKNAGVVEKQLQRAWVGPRARLDLARL